MMVQSAAGDSGYRKGLPGIGDAASADLISAAGIDILNSVNLPVVVVSMDCAVAWFNRAATAVLCLTPGDIGHSLSRIQMLRDQRNIKELCAQVIAGRVPCGCEVRDGEHHFLLRIAAYPAGEERSVGAVLTFTDMTAFRASIGQAIYERQFAKAILNTVSEPLAILNAELRVQSGNRAFFTMFHVSREDVQGRLLTELKHHEWDVPQLSKHLENCLSGKNQLQPIEFDHDFHALGRRTILLEVRRLDGADNCENMLLLSFRDITGLKQEQSARTHHAEQLEQLVLERTEHLHTLATELTMTEQRQRQQLATELHDHLQQLIVLSKLKLGQGKLLAESLPACLAIITESDEILSQALTYTRTLVGELAPPLLKELGLAAGIKWLGEQMRQHQLIVDIDVPSELLELNEVQGVLLFQSVRELLINSAKYAEIGRAHVRMWLENSILYIEVRDEGKGFDVAHVNRQDTTAVSSKFGLFSIRDRMKALGGSFELRAALGKGTVAALTLPLAKSNWESQPSSNLSDGRPSILMSEPSYAPEAQTSECSNREAIRVLLVDDHAMMRQGLRSVLQAYKDVVVVGEARDGEEAIALVEDLRPSLVVMDISMPKMNGIDATLQIKSRHPEIRVIGISVNARGPTEDAIMQAGAELCLPKEAAVKELYRAIRKTSPTRVPLPRTR